MQSMALKASKNVPVPANTGLVSDTLQDALQGSAVPLPDGMQQHAMLLAPRCHLCNTLLVKLTR